MDDEILEERKREFKKSIFIGIKIAVIDNTITRREEYAINLRKEKTQNLIKAKRVIPASGLSGLSCSESAKEEFLKQYDPRFFLANLSNVIFIFPDSLGANYRYRNPTFSYSYQ